MTEAQRGPKTTEGVLGVLFGGLLLFALFGIVGAFVGGAVDRHYAPWHVGPTLVFPGLIVGFAFIMAGFVVMVLCVSRWLGIDPKAKEVPRDVFYRAKAGLPPTEDNGHSTT